MSVTLFQDFAPFQGQEFLKVSLFPKFSNYRFSRNLWRFAGRNFQKCHVFRIPCKKLQFDPYRAGCLQPQWVTLFHKNREFHGQEFSKVSAFSRCASTPELWNFRKKSRNFQHRYRNAGRLVASIPCQPLLSTQICLTRPPRPPTKCHLRAQFHFRL